MMRGADLAILPSPRRVVCQGGTVRRSSFHSVAPLGHLPCSVQKHVLDFAQRNVLTLAPQDEGTVVITLSPKDSTRNAEGYVLQIADRITLKGAGPAGLFYGLQTLQQLFDTCEVIPRCRITDWPALPLRGFYFDLTRQVPTPEFLKLIVDRLATVKLNLLVIQYREFFPYEGFPFIVSKDSYTPKEMSTFLRYARERHIQVVPLLQSLSFQEHILRAQAYAHLRERKEDASHLCPTHPESFELYRLLAEQLITAHSGLKYFHLGADEATGAGHCERCKRVLAKSPKATLFSGFANKAIHFLLDRGVQPIMWADMLFGHFEADPASASRYGRDLFAELSREVITADWDYWSTGPKTPSARRSVYPGVEGLSHLARLLDAGFRVIGAPSCSSGCNAKRNAMDHVLAFANITAFGKELRRRGCLGMLTTFWPTDAYPHVQWYDCLVGSGSDIEAVDVSYNVVRPGLQAHWYSIWRGAECAWSSAPRPKDEYDRVFARVFLGTNEASYPEAIQLASSPISGYGRSGSVSMSRDGKEQKMREAIALLWKAQRSARRDKDAVDYSGLFLRFQHHDLKWEAFLSAAPTMNTPKLSPRQLRTLRYLMAERELLEREFRLAYLAIYKDVHLEEEVQLRHAEERRLQEQLLWAQRRRSRWQ